MVGILCSFCVPWGEGEHRSLEKWCRLFSEEVSRGECLKESRAGGATSCPPGVICLSLVFHGILWSVQQHRLQHISTFASQGCIFLWWLYVQTLCADSTCRLLYADSMCSLYVPTLCLIALGQKCQGWSCHPAVGDSKTQSNCPCMSQPSRM